MTAQPNQPPSALRSALVVSGARILSVILSLVLGVLSATYFGVSAQKDCYLVAQNIPTLFTTIILGGIYSSTLVALAEVGHREGVAPTRYDFRNSSVDQIDFFADTKFGRQ